MNFQTIHSEADIYSEYQSNLIKSYAGPATGIIQYELSLELGFEQQYHIMEGGDLENYPGIQPDTVKQIVRYTLGKWLFKYMTRAELKRNKQHEKAQSLMNVVESVSKAKTIKLAAYGRIQPNKFDFTIDKTRNQIEQPSHSQQQSHQARATRNARKNHRINPS